MNAAGLSSWTPLANHLWQSTAFSTVTWLLTLALKKNRAAVRYWLWFAASIKFLIPFSGLVALGGILSWRTAASAAHPPQWSFIANSAIQPFTSPVTPAQMLSTHTSFDLAPILTVIWLCGLAGGVVFWLKCWLQMRRIRKNSRPLPFGLPIPVLSSPSQIEPGVLGILKPVLLLPAGIESRLAPAQLDAILAHEMAHVRRRDNLTAAIHMLVEIVFWFFPPIWWLRARLIEERELACDEAVLSSGSEPESYAEGILSVCKSYLPLTLACASGVTGSALKRRIAAIMTNRTVRNLDTRRKILLIAAAAIALISPIALGVAQAVTTRSQAQDKGAVSAFDAASVKPHRDTGVRNRTRIIEPGRISYMNISLREMLLVAYGVKWYQISAPDWIQENTYDVVATADKPVAVDQIKRMLGPLLVERFHIAFHRETKQLPVFALVVAKGGPKFEGPGDGGEPMFKQDSNGGEFFQNYSMDNFADWLSIPSMGRPVIDRTRMAGDFSFHANLFEASSSENLKTTMNGFDSFSTVSATLPAQLGLKLEPQIAPLEMFVIDHADKVPTPD